MSDSSYEPDPFDGLPAWDGELPDWEDDGFDHYDLQQWIKAAGGYVRAGDQLRPRVIDEVKERAARRDSWRPLMQITSWGLSAALVWLISLYSLFLLVPRGLTAGEIHERAQRRAEATGITLDWALTEVIKESRFPSNSSHAADRAELLGSQRGPVR